ncbi:mechanosensitive ion channel family protein [Alteromonas lipolytica]|uniref:Mechanosensitive ion channel protein n=1 Tax=Alteromonas lipolytica TaxID=1856405 RepID=A0A1E8FC14_9ALTE|nr:mechanosensitive ion channel domain-containing protein [Alteromonas lipolytica]OFI33449.1 mechanosensitive ion channel protein [Alteromonas lipolytica]GGF59605.1 mechanosensitive ion channel protein [Alteromonas lipolytica]
METTLTQVKGFLAKELFTLFDIQVTVGDLIAVPLIYIVGIWLFKKLAHMATYRLRASGASADTVHLFKRLFYIVASAILIITTLDVMNVPLTAFAFLSGAVAIGVGFGAQNIINNFISGWILMWERPIRIGDFLEVDGSRGTVETINTRSTRIRRIDGVHMLIPNSKLLENTVVNWTLIDLLTRTSVRVGVAYGSDCNKVAALIEQATVSQEDILSDPKPVVIFDDFGDNALMFETFFWVNATKERDLRVIRSQVRFAIDALFNEHDIVIAFPQRDVHLDGTLQLVKPSSNS